MRKFKLKTGIYKVYDLTKEQYIELTQGQSIYSERGADGVKRNFAICPGCDNPIQIIGLYKKLENTDRPYGKHYNRDCKLALHKEQAYRFCPYAKFKYDVSENSRKPVLTDFERNIYNAVREDFDLAIYIIQQDTGLYITTKLAKEILMDYRGTEGHMYYWATLYNIPWMLLQFLSSKKLYGRSVRIGSSLFQFLERQKNVRLEKQNERYAKILNANGRFLEFEFSTIHHKRNVENDILTESIQFNVFLPPDEDGVCRTVWREKLLINEYRFLNLINSPEAQKYRRPDLIQLAKEILSEL